MVITQNKRPAEHSKRDFGSPLGMKLIAGLMRICPRFVVYGISMIPVLWYFLKYPQVRRSAEAYREKLGLPEGHFNRFIFGLRQVRAYSLIILDNMYLGLLGPEHFHLTEFGTEIFRRSLALGRGLILLSAHIGNWHLAVNFLGETNRTVYLVMDDVRLDEVRRKMDVAKNSSTHLTVLPARKEGLVFELLAALKRGDIVILAGDRVQGRRKVKIDFLGGRAWFPTTAYYLAAMSGAPICTALALRTGMQEYACYGLGPFNNPEGDRTKLSREETEKLARRFAEHLEKHVVNSPEQWFNFYDFWAD